MLWVKILAENIDMELPITLEKLSSHTINTFSSGYHEYMSVWMLQIGDDSSFCSRELSNECDEYAVAIVAIDHFKREEVVRQVPSLARIVCELQSYRNKNKQRDWCRTGDTN